MNGLSKIHARAFRWQQLVILFGIMYVIIVAVLAAFVFNIPMLYAQTAATSIETTLQEIKAAATSNDAQKQLDALVEQVPMELVVLTPEAIVYTTMPITQFTELNDSVDHRVLAYENAYEFKSNDQTYQVWVAIYKGNFQDFFIWALLITLGGSVILCLLMLFLLLLVFRKLVGPLQRLRDNIQKLKKYRLSEVGTEQQISDYDLLSEELSEFTEDLQGKLEDFTVNYTSLEQELQARQERNNYKQQLVTALVHDLKTPLNISVIQAERMVQAATPEEADAAAVLVRNNQRVLKDVNEVLNVLRLDDIGDMKQQQQLDVVAVARDTLRLFQPMFQKHDISAILDAPEKLPMIFNVIELKQILHNIISNASQYGDAGGSFELEIDCLNGMLWIRAYNDKADISQIDFGRVFDLFYHGAAGDEHQFSSGVGMYTIKQMVEQHGGNCRFEPFEDGVQLIIELPMDGGDVV